MLLTEAIIKLNTANFKKGAVTVSPELSNALLNAHGNISVSMLIEEAVGYLRVAGKTLNFDLSADATQCA